MKEVIKAFYILAFLGIMIPFGKLIFPNGGLLLIMLLESINSIFTEGMNPEIFTMLIMSLIASVRFSLVLKIMVLFSEIWLGSLKVCFVL